MLNAQYAHGAVPPHHRSTTVLYLRHLRNSADTIKRTQEEKYHRNVKEKKKRMAKEKMSKCRSRFGHKS